jgi:hypothetical protein
MEPRQVRSIPKPVGRIRMNLKIKMGAMRMAMEIVGTISLLLVNMNRLTM